MFHNYATYLPLAGGSKQIQSFCMNTHIVIMAGGVGSRFWPLSTPELPKQFIDILGCGRTLIQLTADRFKRICPMQCNNCVVHAEDAKKVVLQGLDGYIFSEKNGQILLCKRSEEQRIREFSVDN